MKHLTTTVFCMLATLACIASRPASVLAQNSDYAFFDLPGFGFQGDETSGYGINELANANGEASITRNVPLIASNQTILFQAVVQNQCAISQLVVWQFE